MRHSTGTSGHRRAASARAMPEGLLAVAAPSWNLQASRWAVRAGAILGTAASTRAMQGVVCRGSANQRPICNVEAFAVSGRQRSRLGLGLLRQQEPEACSLLISNAMPNFQLVT